MTRANATFFFLFLLLSRSFIAHGQWTSHSLSVARYNIEAVSVGEFVLFAGGNLSATSYSDRVDIYNSNTDTWSTHSLSVARSSMAVATLGTKVFFAGGFDGTNPSGAVDIFDATTGNWSTATLTVARTNVTAVASGNKVLFAGGQRFEGNVFYSAVDVYDNSSGTWSTTVLSQAKVCAAAAAASNKVFFPGGQTGAATYTDGVDVYNTNTGSWSVFFFPSIGMYSAISSGNRVFFIRDVKEGDYAQQIRVYNADLNTTTAFNFNENLNAISSGLIGSKVIFAGGKTGNGTAGSNAYIYDINTSQWTTTPLPVAHAGMAVASDGTRLFFAGGFTSGPEPRSGVVDIYNNTTGTWTSSQLSVNRTALAAASVGEKTFFAGGIASGDIPTDVIDIYVHGCVPPVIEVSPPSASICPGESVTLTASGAETFQWMPSSGLSSASGAQITASPLTTTSYTVRGTLAGADCSGQKEITISVKPLPIFSVPEDKSVCLGESVNITVTGDNNYTWSPASGLSAISGNSVTANPDVTTTYLVTATNSLNCTSAKPVLVTIKQLPPKPVITVTKEPALLISDATTGNQWLIDGEVIPGAINQILPLFDEGNYTLQVTKNGCSNTSDSYAYVITGLENPGESASGVLFPNPVIGDEIELNRAYFTSPYNVRVTLTNLLGNQVSEETLSGTQTRIYVGGLPPGVYIVWAQSRESMMVEKIIRR